MAIAWNSRNNGVSSSGGNHRNCFREHKECMKLFRKSHAEVTIVNAPKCDKLTLLEITRPLHVADLMRVTRRSRCHASMEDWPAFAPVWKVALYKLSQN